MIEPTSAVVGAAESLMNITEQLGLLDKLKRKLMKQPDVAAAKLETVLIEITKIYGVLAMTVDDYLGLWLIPDAHNEKFLEELGKLRRFAAGSHEPAMRKAKGDCKKIGSIYEAYLRPWFSDVLDRDEADALRALFRELNEVDSVMVDAIDATAEWLTAEAEATLELVRAKDYNAADQRIQGAWDAWAPAASRIREGMNRLYDFRAIFIERTGAV
jgi:hypothetical protein